MDDDPCPPTLFSLPSFSQETHKVERCSVGRAEDELVELLWQNGQVFMLSQTHREAVGRPCQKPESAPRCVEPLDPLPHPARNEDASPWLPSPRRPGLLWSRQVTTFWRRKGQSSGGSKEAGRSRTLTASKGSDIHGSCSSSVKVPSAKGADDSQAGFSYSEIQEAGIASTSDGSALSLRVDDWRSTDTGNYKKRKRKDVDESQCQNEETEDKSVEATRPCRRSVPARRARAAQVHNLSRRDRINEKMRALQELIPHCNKTDKVSMLDEAIEYLKSLQLQVQVQDNADGGGITPMMFLGLQHSCHQWDGDEPGLMPTFTPPIQLPRSYPAYLAFQDLQPSPQVNSDEFIWYGSKLMEGSQMLPMAVSSEDGSSAALPENFPNLRPFTLYSTFMDVQVEVEDTLLILMELTNLPMGHGEAHKAMVAHCYVNNDRWEPPQTMQTMTADSDLAGF
ncbi:unnamed protein product [Spirodela intermedia]|uniref:BHLH domain-containing protein n=1 Tax=Spirodela intermedia TaxID=51605 RepID=A0A7I8JFQ0_SPIIN|nr:unnamed protein product [Spirodela intermedia]CAA6668555.1 unnamed protein product [Spirodela intermedia]